MTHSPDQLRWQLTPVLAIAIDAGENILVDVGGNRARVDNVKHLAEAVRQAGAAQRGDPPPDREIELAALRSFVQQVASFGEPEPDSEACETLAGLIHDARALLGIPDPDPDPDPCSEADLDEAPASFRWNDHQNERGHWCPCSHLPVSIKLAGSDDKRCLHECPDSTIEPMPGPADTSPDLNVVPILHGGLGVVGEGGQ